MNRYSRADRNTGGIVGGLALLVLAAAGMLAMAAVTRMDTQVASEMHRQYCQDVALWQAEAARGVPLNRRVGQPDWKGIAAEQCPARVQPMDHTAQRQLVQF
ncbi:hypothetical protein [Halomonas organivorans]|uniref:Uncharacterized protein n=1 Tax=Halomonas organivorans TaxID=257772 RepID=A0A7W5G716_9GAMM|nr:hypothetical protein [Halomonas organivorans]MBB3142789.1 hypothetical protein [Halomonas organivorans]